MKKQLKRLVTIGMVACLSVASSMMAFAGQTPALSFFGQQPVAESDSDYMTSYKIVVVGKNTISRNDIQVVDSNGWNVSVLDNMQDTSLSTIAIDDSYMIQLSNDTTDQMQQYWIYCLGDGETVESLGDNAKYVIYANGSTTSTQSTEKTATWASDSKGWWIQYSDGTYLTNGWYQSPVSGLYYYMGVDGYMLTNTTTPDGYYVNADGVWVQ